MIDTTKRVEQRLTMVEGEQTKLEQQLKEVWEMAHKEVIEIQDTEAVRSKQFVTSIIKGRFLKIAGLVKGSQCL